MTDGMRDGSTVPGFLMSEFPEQAADSARFHIVPAPMECTVSYGRGTSAGPAAILRASQQLEAYDGGSCPGAAGIHTAAVPDFGGNGQRCRAP